jgi:hypothetical protein
MKRTISQRTPKIRHRRKLRNENHLNCENCGHQIIEPVISNYCTNCGKLTGITKEHVDNKAPIPIQSPADPVFKVRSLNSVFFPVIASLIPVSFLAYFGGGVGAAIALTSIDFLIVIAISLRATTYKFFNDKLRIFRGINFLEEIEYSKIEENAASFSSRDHVLGLEHEGKVIIKVNGNPDREFEIPSNPRNPELKTDLANWLNSRIGESREISST